jgi:hypothetical protein
VWKGRDKSLTNYKAKRDHHCQPEIKVRRKRRATHNLQSRERPSLSAKNESQIRDESHSQTAR